MKRIFQPYDLHSPFSPKGDQIRAIDELYNGLKEGKKHQVLLGATGTGKTFTISNIIAKANRPVIIMAHNKTLVGRFIWNKRFLS